MEIQKLQKNHTWTSPIKCAKICSKFNEVQSVKVWHQNFIGNYFVFRNLVQNFRYSISNFFKFEKFVSITLRTGLKFLKLSRLWKSIFIFILFKFIIKTSKVYTYRIFTNSKLNSESSAYYSLNFQVKTQFRHAKK